MSALKIRPSKAATQKGDAMETSAKDAAVEWFVRMRDEPVSPAVAKAFEAWLLADASHAKAYGELERLWSGLDHAGFGETPVVETSAAEEHSPRVSPEAVHGAGSRKIYRLAYAASILLTVLVGAYVLNNPALFAGHHTNPGERKTIASTDGSTIEMNTASALSVDFDESFRKVTLYEGEAYFEIDTDPTRPFVVNAGDLQVQALGTAFSVQYTGNEVRVIVTESSVRVTGSDGENAVVAAGHGVRAAGDRLGRVQSVDARANLSWRNGRLIFLDRPFEEALSELERYLPGTLLIMDDSLNKIRVSGSFSITDPSAILDVFEQIFPIKVVRVGGVLTLVYPA